jgi:hypothetical protein
MRKPREPYGTQKPGSTIRSVSLDAEVAAWLNEMAARAISRGRPSASMFVNSLLKNLREKSTKP